MVWAGAEKLSTFPGLAGFSCTLFDDVSLDLSGAAEFVAVSGNSVATVATDLDREVAPHFEADVYCQAWRGQQQIFHVVKKVRLTVGDENDNVPVAQDELRIRVEKPHINKVVALSLPSPQ